VRRRQPERCALARYLSGQDPRPKSGNPDNPQASTGVITAVYGKDPTDPPWKDDPGFKDFAGFVTKYLSPAQLKRLCCCIRISCRNADDAGVKAVRRQLPLGLPGTKVNTSPENYFPIRQMQLSRFNGENCEPFGDLMSD